MSTKGKGKRHQITVKDEYEKLYPKMMAIINSDIYGKGDLIFALCERMLTQIGIPIDDRETLEAVKVVLNLGGFDEKR